MGATSSKHEKPEKHDGEELVFDRRFIYFDADGNLRYDEHHTHLTNVDEEIRDIMQHDMEDESCTVWYIMESAWVTAWLAYAYTQKGISPRPGPCNNNRLLVWDEGSQRFIKRDDILMASKVWKGDYRRVSEKVWNTFLKYYPESGPTIVVECPEGQDFSQAPWKVLNATFNQHQHKRKKRVRLSGSIKNILHNPSGLFPLRKNSVSSRNRDGEANETTQLNQEDHSEHPKTPEGQEKDYNKIFFEDQ